MDEQSVVEAMDLARADIANMKQQLELTHQNNLLQIAKMVPIFFLKSYIGDNS